jgi:2-polyprenyl-3-methyl-5-hydroxy-6-metoxy-1,4-benzoquinol methylase
MALTFAQMLQVMKKRYPNFSGLWEQSRADFGPEWEDDIDLALAKVFDDDEKAVEEIVDGYAEFSTDAIRSQIYFERKGEYKASNYDEVAQAYYHNRDFMFRCYLPGMLVSHFVWPHHFRMLSWFRNLLTDLGPNVRTFCEVGTGCGLYSEQVLERVPSSRGIGYDISDSALEFTKRVADSFGHGDLYDTTACNIITNPPKEQFDLALSQEVLEHLEDPVAYMRALRNMVRPGRYAYIAAAINAAHVDHIYLYRSPDEVATEIEEAGFTILKRHSELAYTGKPLKVTPCHAGFLCQRD